MESLKVVASPLPFSNLQKQETIPCGETLLEIVDAVIPSRYGDAVGAVVFINGHKINKCYWHKVKPKSGTLINIRVVPQGGGGGKNPLNTILSLAVIVAAPYIAATLAPTLAAGATAGTLTIGQSIAFAGIKAGITVVGMMAVNAIAPPPKQRVTPSESPTLLIEGARNRYNPYGTIPVYLGRNRVFPDQCAKSYTETVGNQQYVRQLFMLGFGNQIQITQPRIGDTPLNNFQNLETETFLNGDLHTGGKLWANSVNQEAQNILLSNSAGWVRRVLPTGRDEVVVDFTFPAGLNDRDSKGKRHNRTVELEVQYKKVSDTAWVGGIEFRTIAGRTFTNAANPAWSSGKILFWFSKSSSTLQSGLDTSANDFTTPIATIPPDPDKIMIAELTWRDVPNPTSPFLPSTRTYTFSDVRNPALFGKVFQDSSSFVPSRSGNDVTISSGGYSNEPLKIISNTAEVLIRSHRVRFPERGDYEIRVRRRTGDVSNDRISDRVYLTSTKSIVYQRPVNPQGLNGYAVRIQATEQLNGAIDEFNLVVTSVLPDYSPWLGDWSVTRATRNPASLYLYVLRGNANAKPIPDTQIDWEKFVEWWEYCAERGYTCDLPVDYESSVDDVLRLIASSGSASPDLIDGKRSVVIDRGDKEVVQIVTPRNSWGYSGEMIYPKLPHAFRVTFRNELRNYLTDERKVYIDGYDESNATVFEELQLPFCTNPDLAYRHGRRYLATALLRPENHMFNMDLENLVMTRGDRIKLQHDIPLIGVGNGRIKQIVLDDDGNAAMIILDDTIVFPESGTFFVRVRFDDGSQLYREIIATVGPSKELVFTSALEPVDTPKVGDLCYVTTAGGELDLIVKSIEPQNDQTARISCLNYAPEIFGAETGTIPPFNSNITTPFEFLAPEPPVLVEAQSDETVMIRNIDGTFTTQAVFTLENRNENTVTLDVLYRESGATEWLKPKILSSSPTSLAIANLDDGTRYDIWVRYKRVGGQFSIPLQINNYLVVGRESPPSDVTNFEIDVTGQTAILTWDKNEDIDFSHYELRFSSSPVGVIWETAQVLVEQIFENRITIIAQSGTYLIKAVDLSDNYSVNANSIITIGIEGVLNAVAVLREDPDFSGEKNNTEVFEDGLTLINITPPIAQPDSGYLSDLFPSNVFDLDARVLESYSGSGTSWSNLTASPADGASQSDYDFEIPSSNVGFSGTAGGANGRFVSSADLNGVDGQFARVLSNTTFLNSLHRSDTLQPYSIALMLKNKRPNYGGSFIRTSSNIDPVARFSAIEEQAPNFTFTRSTTANRINENGLLESTPINEIRHQYDLSGNYQGYLFERQTVNYFQYSEDFRSTAEAGSTRPWSEGNTVTTINAGLAPNGANTANEILVAGLNGKSYNLDMVTGENAISFYFKKGSAGSGVGTHYVTIRATAYDIDTNSRVVFDLSNGTIVGSAGGLRGEIYEASNGFYRCCIYPVLAGTDLSGQIFVYFPYSIALPYDQDNTGRTYFMWGAQAERGRGSASSYVPTTTGVVTRASDFGSYTLPSAITEGTLYWEGTDVGGMGGNGVLFSLSDGTSANTVWIQRVSNERLVCLINVGGVEYRLLTANGAVPFFSAIRAAISFRAGQVLASVNGITLSLSTGTIPVSINSMSISRIGSYANGANVNESLIHRDGAIYDVSLNQDQLNSLTRPD